MKVLFSGGGTGGHIYPALAAADALRALRPETEIVFIGTPDKIESRVVPENGYAFESIAMKGLPRKNIVKIIGFLFGFGKTLFQAVKKIRRIKPDVAVGSGGYVSVTPLLAARLYGAPLILLESNSYPGLATKLLQRFAEIVHLNYSDAAVYIHDKSKVRMTGNPVRTAKSNLSKDEVKQKLGIPAGKKVMLILGGSLGAGSLNKKLSTIIGSICHEDRYIIWQTGAKDFNLYSSLNSDALQVAAFIDDMTAYYSVADMVVCRGGATTLTELAIFGLPAVVIPSPNVTDDHQTANARALVNMNAALLVEEKNIEQELVEKIEMVIADEKLRGSLSANILASAKPDAAKVVAESIIDTWKKKSGNNV